MTRRVLICDDEPDIVMIVKATLETLGGLEVLVATSGPQALDLALAESPDALLLDVMMPGVDGPTTVQRIRDDPKTRDLPIVLLTARARAAERAALADLPVQGVITKPFDPRTLASQLGRLLGWS